MLLLLLVFLPCLALLLARGGAGVVGLGAWRGQDIPVSYQLRLRRLLPMPNCAVSSRSCEPLIAAMAGHTTTRSRLLLLLLQFVAQGTLQSSLVHQSSNPIIKTAE